MPLPSLTQKMWFLMRLSLVKRPRFTPPFRARNRNYIGRAIFFLYLDLKESGDNSPSLSSSLQEQELKALIVIASEGFKVKIVLWSGQNTEHLQQII